MFISSRLSNKAANQQFTVDLDLSGTCSAFFCETLVAYLCELRVGRESRIIDHTVQNVREPIHDLHDVHILFEYAFT